MLIPVTRDNYFSLEIERQYMSRSQYEGFLECEAQAVARLQGEWSEDSSAELLVGSYVHSWHDGTMHDFMANTPQMFTQKLTLRSEFKQADAMIETLKNDQFIMYLLEDGQKEVIFTAEFAGVWWKIRIDNYKPEKRRMIDLKTTKSITGHVWDEEAWGKVSFVEKYNYPLQAAIYSEIERKANERPEEDWFDFYIVAVSKQDPPDKAVIDMRSPERYIQELSQIKANMPKILAVKNKEVEPVRCELCSYCRSTKQLAKTIHYSLL